MSAQAKKVAPLFGKYSTTNPPPHVSEQNNIVFHMSCKVKVPYLRSECFPGSENKKEKIRRLNNQDAEGCMHQTILAAVSVDKCEKLR